MHAIGDGGDGHFLYGEFGPEILEHLLRNGAVEDADGVAEGGGFEGKDGHRETLRVVLHVGAAERQ